MSDSFARTLRKGEVMKDSSEKPAPDVVLLLDDVYDTFNVGGMYRVADAAGVGAIYHCGDTPIPPDPKIARSSVGLYQYLHWEHRKDIMQLLEELKKAGYQIVSLEQSDVAVNYFEATYKGPVALVVGNESFGVKDEVVKASDLVVELPMHGVNKSLNVVVATGIVLYEIHRKLL